MNKQTKNLLWGGAIVVLGLMLLGVISVPKISLGTLSIGADSVDTTAQEVEASRQLVIDSLVLQGKEKYSEDALTGSDGNIYLYDEGTNPKDPSATATHTLNFSTAYTSSDIVCGKVYRVVFGHTTTAYAKDFGDQVLVDCTTEYNENTADATVDLSKKFGWKMQTVATLSDVFDETATTGILNGHTNTNVSAGGEIGCVDGCSADSTLIYDESNGDGTFYLDLSFGASGSQSELSEPVVCFEHDSTNGPEGNEISDIVVQRLSGTDFGISASTNWESVFANEECVKLGDSIQAGVSGDYRFTITYSEANLDTNDDYMIIFDDLADNKGKDARLNVGATRDAVDFDAQA